jgi:hypothetical protein
LSIEDLGAQRCADPLDRARDFAGDDFEGIAAALAAAPMRVTLGRDVALTAFGALQEIHVHISSLPERSWSKHRLRGLDANTPSVDRLVLNPDAHGPMFGAYPRAFG